MRKGVGMCYFSIVITVHYIAHNCVEPSCHIITDDFFGTAPQLLCWGQSTSWNHQAHLLRDGPGLYFYYKQGWWLPDLGRSVSDS